MALNNTTILPDNTVTSQNLLTASLNQGDLLIVIFGNNLNSQNAVQTADYKANSVVDGIGRKVVWMQDTSMLGFLIASLKPGPIPPSISSTQIDLTIHIGVSISPDGFLMYLILNNPLPDAFTMETAFIAAGQ